MQLKTVTIIGVGLIGGSIAHGLKENKVVSTIIGVDNQIQNLTTAKRNEIIDIGVSVITQDVLQSDVVIIATPVAMIPTVLKSISQFNLSAETVITDVASTKRGVLQAFKEYLPQHYAYCVAGHPVAGCEKSGVDNIISSLFGKQKVILCPHTEQNERSMMVIQKLWTSLQADIHIMEADLHDQIFAMTSHLPHILAYSFINQLNDDVLQQKYLTFAGSGFRDFTRIAASDPEMWSGICIENQDFLLELLAKYKKELEAIEFLLAGKNKEQIKAYFANSQETRRAWGNSKISYT